MSGPTVAAARVDTAEVRSLGVMPVKAEPVNASADDAASTASAAHFRALAIVVRSWMKTVLRRGVVGFVCALYVFSREPFQQEGLDNHGGENAPPGNDRRRGGRGAVRRCPCRCVTATPWCL